jgi:hypothetical protein
VHAVVLARVTTNWVRILEEDGRFFLGEDDGLIDRCPFTHEGQLQLQLLFALFLGINIYCHVMGGINEG